MSAVETNMAHDSTIRSVWPPRSVWLVHAAANLVLAGLAYSWLWIPDAKMWQFAAAVLLGLSTIAGALALHAATLTHFHAAHRGERPRWWTTFKATLARLPALALWLALFAALLWLLAWMEGRGRDWAAVAAAWLTLKLQRPVRPETLYAVFSYAVAIVRWFVAPLFFLPLALQVARGGFSGFRWQGLRRTAKIFRRLRYWLGYVVLFVACAYLPYRLTLWVPEVSTLTLEAASAAVRFLVAYTIGLTGWLMLLSLIAKLDSASLPEPHE